MTNDDVMFFARDTIIKYAELSSDGPDQKAIFLERTAAVIHFVQLLIGEGSNELRELYNNTLKGKENGD